MPDDTRAYWDAQAADFDREPDHGLADPSVRRAWSDLVRTYLPPAPADIADLGCGTGSLAVLLAADGHDVAGLDLSDRMVEQATRKAQAAGVPARFEQGDAAVPPFAPGSFDVVLSRHVLWAMPDPADALRRWTQLLRPQGRLILIEGRWHTGGGITSTACRRLVLGVREEADVVPLDDEALWGRPIDDERYLVFSSR